VTTAASIISQLQAHEQRYTSLFGRNPDVLFALDVEGVIRYCNPALELLTGVPFEELEGRSFFSFLAADDRERARRHFVRAVGGEAQSFEVTGLNEDGREFAWLTTMHGMHDRGIMEGVHGIARDISRQRETERALRETDERYRLLADHVDDMISLHDAAGVFIYASPSTTKMLGYHPVELIGRSVYDLVDNEDIDPLRSAHDDILEHEGKRPVVYRARRADGSIGWFETAATMVNHEETGEPWRIIAVTRDITQRRDVEHHLLHSQKMEALGRLAGGIAHDFNNILTVITGHAELLTSQLADGTVERVNAEHIRESAHRATALTRQLLTFGRTPEKDERVVDLNAILLELQPMLARLLGEDITLSLELESKLHTIRCEPASLEQVIVNLAVNAREAMPDGGRLTIRTENFVQGDSGTMPPGEYVRLTVTDTGLGMSPEVSARVFEPFFSTKHGDQGTGLGLSTVYNIVTQVGGDVSLESEPGSGTTFRLCFPGLAAPAVGPEQPRTSKSKGHDGETILVAEDDPGVRALVVATLQRYGYRVMAAVDGMQALELFRTYGHLIHLVVTDVNMPELKGTELVRILADNGLSIPVLFISGFTSESLSLNDKGPRRSFLGKPFTPVELAQAVRRMLDEAAANQ
jgi:two-component system, cell cycle sensor histidine kinase and response regulator CckA